MRSRLVVGLDVTIGALAAIGLDHAPASPCGLRASTLSRESQEGPGLSLLETAEVAAAQCTDNVRFTFGPSDVDLPSRYVAGYKDGPFIDVNQHYLKEVRQVASPKNTVSFVIGLDENRRFVVDGAASPPHVTVRVA